MRRTLALFAVAAAAALVAGPALSQDRSGGKKPSGDCDLKTIEKAKYCEKCDKEVGKEDIDKDGKHKGDCGTKVKDIEICVKKTYSAKCHPDKELKPGGS